MPLNFTYSNQECTDLNLTFSVSVIPDSTYLHATYNTTHILLGLHSYSLNHFDEYQVQILATLPTGQRKRATFTLRLQKLNSTTTSTQPSVIADIISKPPQFSRSLPSNLRVKRGYSQGYTFPPVLNPEFM
jgi:hypothetical protein